LTKHAVEREMIEVDPALDARKYKVESGGHHCWTDDEISWYRTHHRSGTKARLAFELFLWTGARRGDAVRLGRQHFNRGSLTYVAEKNRVEVCIPILPEFQVEMAAMPKSQMLFLETVHGRPHSVKAFGAWFKKRRIEADLPNHCTAHGLRKARARIMAEAGKTAHQIAVWAGWKTLAEVVHYTEAANRKRLTHDGVEQEQNFGNSAHKVSKNPEKTI
jgi:integrase